MNTLQHALVAILLASSLPDVWAQSSASNAANDWQNSTPCPDWASTESGSAPAANKRWELTLSPYTLHWQSSPEHKPVVLSSLDRAAPGNRLCGLSFFSNSFGQPSTYVYVGQRWDSLIGNPNLFAKITAGIFYGYVGQYKDKVPYNYKGFSPGIIPSVGYQLTPTDSAQLLVLGTAGLMFAYGHTF
jgi:hypothetical protein